MAKVKSYTITQAEIDRFREQEAKMTPEERLAASKALVEANTAANIITYASWSLTSDTSVVKHCDKSFFEYRGSTIPREVYWFFEADDLKAGDKRDLKLSYNGRNYNAYLQKETHKLGRIRIFWEQKLGDEFDKFNTPGRYPRLAFNKKSSVSYEVAFEGNPLSHKAVEVSEALLQLIVDGEETITYGELSSMTASKPNPHLEIPDILDSINKRCYELGLPCISAMVINKDTLLPGSGFKTCCVNYYNYSDEADIEEMQEIELDKIFECDEWDMLADDLGIDMPVNEYDKSEEYDQVEMDSIDTLIQSEEDLPVPEWTGSKEAQAMTSSVQTGHDIPKRDPQRAADALRRASYLCEYDSTDRTFLRKNGRPYTEPHHLIPISKYRDFEYSVDVMENIVSLCSHCHNLLHYGRFEDKKPILEKLYNDRKEALSSCGLEITLEELEEYYK